MARFHPLADRELTDAAIFYESQARGLGNAFLTEIERLLAVLAAHPSIGRPVRDCRTISLRRFPYSLIYQAQGDGVFILAIAHHRRRPAYWVDRAGAP